MFPGPRLQFWGDLHVLVCDFGGKGSREAVPLLMGVQLIRKTVMVNVQRSTCWCLVLRPMSRPKRQRFQGEMESGTREIGARHRDSDTLH